MPKVRSVFRCSECGGASPKWVGRCPSCEEWNTLVEELDVPDAGGVGRSWPALDRAVPDRRGRRRRVAPPARPG